MTLSVSSPAPAKRRLAPAIRLRLPLHLPVVPHHDLRPCRVRLAAVDPPGRRPEHRPQRRCALDLRRASSRCCWPSSWPSSRKGPSTPRRWRCSASWPRVSPRCGWRAPASTASSPSGSCSILAARVFGRGFGFVLGAVAFFASALITGGVGPWLPFQMLAAAWVGFGAGCLPAMRGFPERLMLAGYGVVSALLYGLLINFWFWPFVGSTTNYHSCPGSGRWPTCTGSSSST